MKKDLVVSAGPIRFLDTGDQRNPAQLCGFYAPIIPAWSTLHMHRVVISILCKGSPNIQHLLLLRIT
jgi:hypothetical protein